MCAANGRFLRAAQYGDGGGEIVWAEPTARRVRVFFGDTAVADSNDVMILFNGRRVPLYFFPRSDVRSDLFEKSAKVESDARLGKRAYESIVVGERRADDAVLSYSDPI